MGLHHRSDLPPLLQALPRSLAKASGLGLTNEGADPSVKPMADSSYLRDKADQALRLARDSTDPMLQKSLTELALEYSARAAAIEALALGEDPEAD